MAAHLRLGLSDHAAEDRRVEPVVEHVPGRVGHRGLPPLGRPDQPLQPGPVCRRRARQQLTSEVQPAPQHLGDEVGQLGDPGEGTEQPERRPCQQGPVLLALDAVPREHSFEPQPEPRRQAAAVGVEPPEVLEHELLGAGLVRDVLVAHLRLGARAIEGPDVREQVEEGVLSFEEVVVGRVAALDAAPVGGAQGLGGRRVQVETEQVCREVVEDVGRWRLVLDDEGRKVDDLCRREPRNGSGRRWDDSVDLIRSSGSPCSTCWLGSTTTAVTRPSRGAVSVLTIFIDSRVATGWPAVTGSPAVTSRELTRAGAGERTTTPSSRVTVWATPSISRRITSSWVTATTRRVRPPTRTRRSYGLWVSTTASSRASPCTRYRSGPVRSTRRW